MCQKCQEELKIFAEYSFPEYVQTDLAEYYKAKVAYMSGNRDVFIERKYDMIYTSLKSQWVCGRITEQDFWGFVAILKEGIS